MRTTLLLALLFVSGGCGESDNGKDGGAGDMHVAMDLAAGGGDMTVITPFNMPGKVFCYSGPLCSSPTQVCCDSKGADGGFSDTCVASAADCLATDPQAKTFACGQAADCGSGMVCCGSFGTSKTGKKFFESTVCAASCASSETQLCVTTSECKASGTSCVGQDITGRNVGLCQ